MTPDKGSMHCKTQILTSRLQIFKWIITVLEHYNFISVAKSTHYILYSVNWYSDPHLFTAELKPQLGIWTYHDGVPSLLCVNLKMAHLDATATNRTCVVNLSLTLGALLPNGIHGFRLGVQASWVGRVRNLSQQTEWGVAWDSQQEMPRRRCGLDAYLWVRGRYLSLLGIHSHEPSPGVRCLSSIVQNTKEVMWVILAPWLEH